MSQPVKVSDDLVLDARLTGAVAERSIAGQIEYWARLGRAIEPILRNDQALALRKQGDAIPLWKVLKEVSTEAGRARVAQYLASQPYPHFEASGKPGYIVRIEADGTRTTGRFINRKFVPACGDSKRLRDSLERPAK